ncbi:MAG: M20/M25/M40 family metallo-hydrolase [Gemmatimonadaceae bacterium]
MSHFPLLRVLGRGAAVALLLASPLQSQPSEKVDLPALAKIREEGMQRSKVMEITSYLTDVYGARLTGSPSTKAAGEWVVGQLKGWGMSNPRLETWGPFGRGWSSEKFTARVVAPTQYPLIAYPGAWSPGTNGPVTGEVAVVRVDSLADLAKYRGKLAGKWVMFGAVPVVRPHWEPMSRRFTDAQLDSMAALPPQVQQQGGFGGGQNSERARAMAELSRQRTALFRSEGIAGVLQPGRGDGGTVFAQGAGSRAVNAPWTPATIIVSAEHYGRMARTLEKGIPVKVEIEADNRFYDADLNSFNVVAEIPGTDRRLRDEIVMLGAHFDSWQTGTGATDNAAGSAVMIEALRILKASGLPMRRTVRIGLWTGEEQGLIGSRMYVTENFGMRDSTGLHAKPAHETFSAYYNVDNGTGAIRGVYLQSNEAVRPIFQAWMEPFRDLGMRATTIRNTGGTDHQSFDRVGLPGFQFIQDPVEYGTRTHHSNQDVFERIQEEDMKKNAVIVASFVYLTANRDEKLPRKPVTLTP